MKRSMMFSFFLLCSFCLMAQAEKAELKNTAEKSKAAKQEAPEEVFTVVENMPRFPGCEELEGQRERKRCADEKMLRYIYGNLKYPAEARSNKTQGAVVIRFFIGKDGSINDARIAKDIGDGCGEAALSVIEHMPTWIPGTQRGKAVNVYFNLPIRFKL